MKIIRFFCLHYNQFLIRDLIDAEEFYVLIEKHNLAH